MLHHDCVPSCPHVRSRFDSACSVFLSKALKAYFVMQALLGFCAVRVQHSQKSRVMQPFEILCVESTPDIPSLACARGIKLSQCSEGLQQAVMHACSCVTTEAARQGRSALDMGVFMIRNTRWSRALLDTLAHRARTTHSVQARCSATQHCRTHCLAFPLHFC